MATQSAPSNMNWRTFTLEKRQVIESKEQPIQDDTFSRPDLRLNVFVSKDGTSALARIILPEPWGPEFENLYKFIDYTWRAALFNRQVFQFTEKGKECLVFHSGLQRRVDGEFIYFVLVPNDDESKVQKWRIASSPAPDWSFQTAGDLLQFVDGDRNRLPQQTKFYKEPSEVLFDASAVVNVDWVRMIETCRERIVKAIVEEVLMLEDRTATNVLPSLLHVLPPRNTMKDVYLAVDKLRERNYHVPDANVIRSTFVSAFDRSVKIVQANPGIVVPQGFVDTHKHECRLELLFPLLVEFDVRAGRSEKLPMCFCVALQREPTYNGYKGMSVLTAQMGYTNARLVGLVYQSWLLAAAWPEFYSSPLFSSMRPHREEKQPVQSLPPMMASTARLTQASVQRSAPPNLGRTMAARVQTEASVDDSRSRSLFVRNIPSSWTEDVIRRKFAQVGPVNRLTMLPNRNKGSDKLLCLIEMKNANDAVMAIRRLHNGTDENGLSVEPSRGPRNSRRTTVTAPSVSLPPAFAPHKLTLEISNVGHHQTASSFLELLKFADIDEGELLWIVVYQPDNRALVRFRTADQIERAQRMFMLKAEFGYICKKIRNPPLANFPNESFWKIEGGDTLSRELSARLDETKLRESFFENPRDERTSAKIIRYSETMASRYSPQTKTSVPLLRVEQTSWRSPSRWRNSRLRKNTGRRRLNKSETEPDQTNALARSALNPNATAFNPSEDVDEDLAEERAPVGANFVPHDHCQWNVLRGSAEWNQLEHQVSWIRGVDVLRIVEWSEKVAVPTKSGLSRRQGWIASHHEHVRMLENEGFLAKYGNSGRGRKKGFAVFLAPDAALASISVTDASDGCGLILCDVFLNSAEENELIEKNWARMIADCAENGRVDRIVPKFVFHTSYRRVGR